MKSPFIKSVEIRPVSYQLAQPFVTAAGRKTETHNVEIRLTLTDGTRGIGEASSSIAMPSESQSAMKRALQETVADLRGRPIDDYRTLIATLWRQQPYHPTAIAAMECALFDAYTRVKGKSLASFLGGKQTTVETDLTISVGSPASQALVARAAARKGFKRLKVKLSGRDPAEDLARLQAVRAAAPKAQLVADGNQGFGLFQALNFVHQLQKLNIPLVFFEQPFAKHDLRSMRLFRKRSKVPLFADESVLTAADAAKLLESGAADGVNIKIAKSGIVGALDIINIATRMKKRLAIGCMEESKIGLAASVHLACGTGAFEWVDLDSVYLLEPSRVRGGFTMKGPRLSVAQIRLGVGL